MQNEIYILMRNVKHPSGGISRCFEKAFSKHDNLVQYIKVRYHLDVAEGQDSVKG